MLGHCWNEDSIAEILINLPVKSLIRFKSVAKSWCALFESPHFTRSHLKVSKKKSRILVRYQDCVDPGVLWVTRNKLFLDETLQDLSHSPIYFDLIFHGEGWDDYFSHHFCVSDGLFCSFLPRDDRVYLCNIATRDMLVLPVLARPQVASDRGFVDTLAIGLRVDVFFHTYKILFARLFEGYGHTPHYRIVQFGVYSSSTGSWRELKVDNLKQNWDDLANATSEVIGGILYWAGDRWSDDGLFVFTFHFDDEVFKEIEAPPLSPYAGEDKPIYRMLEHQGLAWLAVCYGWERFHESTGLLLEPPRFYDFWVLSGDDGHWTKQLKIGPLFGVFRVLRFWKNGWIFMESVNGELLLYDPDTGKMRELGINVMFGGSILHVYTYEQSLVRTSILAEARDQPRF